jgi:hypothetical protein
VRESEIKKIKNKKWERERESERHTYTLHPITRHFLTFPYQDKPCIFRLCNNISNNLKNLTLI